MFPTILPDAVISTAVIVPVNVGEAVLALVADATAMALYSSSISVPRTIFSGLPLSSVSLDAKSVTFV